MEEFSIEVRRSTFPFNTKTFIKVGNRPVFVMNSGESREVSLPDEGKYEVEVKSFWINVRKSVVLTRQTPILKIDFALPDSYFIVSAFFIIPLAILSLIGIVEPYISAFATLLFFVPILYFTFIATKGYFKIVSKKRN